MNNKSINNTNNTNNKINTYHPSKQDLINRTKRLRKKRILAYTKLALFCIFVILIIFFIILGVKTIFNKINRDENEKEIIENNNKRQNKNEEKGTSKYTKEIDYKLKNLNYINKKIDYFKMNYIDRYIKYKENNTKLSNDKVVLYVNIGLDYEFYTNINLSPNQNTNTVLVNKYYYVDQNYVPKDLVSIDSKYQVGGKKLTADATDAFNRMAKDAKDQGYTIRAVSTYRSYEYQQNLYTNYAKKDGTKKADTYSARAGYSEHQTGLAVDVDNKSKSYTKFGETEEFTWMKENAHKYGFILRYTKENEFITGYKNEPWHYRYVGIEIATQMKQENISSYEEYYFMYLDK